ncbi:MAG: TRAP transporter small permease [Synergistaceae bacterium]|nr:TRAP transporter small permease [Synergistaceae bacterium]
MPENMEQDLEKEKENEPILIFEGRSLKPKGLFDKITIGSFEAGMVFCSLALSIIIVAAAFMRYVVRGDLYGYEEWVKLLAFWLYFLGGAYGAYNDTHVSADLIDSYLPQGMTRHIMIFIRQLITSAMSLVFTYFGYFFFMYGLLGPISKEVLRVGWGASGLAFNWNGVSLVCSQIDILNGSGLTFNIINLWTTKAIARTTVWQIPLWTSYAAIFLGLIFMSIFFTRRCIHTGIALFKGEGGKRA